MSLDPMNLDFDMDNFLARDRCYWGKSNFKLLMSDCPSVYSSFIYPLQRDYDTVVEKNECMKNKKILYQQFHFPFFLQ